MSTKISSITQSVLHCPCLKSKLEITKFSLKCSSVLVGSPVERRRSAADAWQVRRLQLRLAVGPRQKRRRLHEEKTRRQHRIRAVDRVSSLMHAIRPALKRL